MEQNRLKKLIFGKDYYSIEDLRYNQKIGILLSKNELTELFDEKEKLIENGDKNIECCPLKSFNSKYIFFVNGIYLLERLREYFATYTEDFKAYKQPIENRNAEDIFLSRIFSEVEGTLNVENVNTTHKRVREIYHNAKPANRDDVIIKNMLDAVAFIRGEKPAFNKENLLRLYKILSRDCLDEEDKLKDGMYYRHEGVSVGDFEGAPTEKVEACMDSLFAFVNDPENVKKYGILLPQICHYYILYVHPYFDYNGRTARMVSFWISVLFEIDAAPLFMSEAINDNKNDYYKAIINTRITRNDMTYFLGYILDIAIKYSLIYKNLEQIRQKLSETGDSLTSTEFGYIKKILVHYPEGFFDYKSFIGCNRISMSRTRALNLLNDFVQYGILEKSTNKKGLPVFKINQNIITYKTKDH